MYEERFMRRAIELSAQALETPGAQPFGAVIVKDGEIVGEGLNMANANHDPTSHGETEAIRDACRKLGTVDLRGTTMYASCEPCPMCVATMGIAGIAELFYGADGSQSAAYLGGLPEEVRFPVDIARVRSEAGKLPAERQMPTTQALRDEAAAVLEAWGAKQRGA